MWLAYYEPNAEEFEREEGDWFRADRDEMVGNMSRGVRGRPPSRRRRRTHEPDGEPDEVGALQTTGTRSRTGRRVAWAWWDVAHAGMERMLR